MLQYSNPVPLSRAWCIWEIFCTLNPDEAGRRADLEVIMPPDDEKRLGPALALRFDDVVEKLSSVDIINAEAFMAEDKDNIFSAISKTLGVDEINRLVSKEIRKWMISTGFKALDSLSPSREGRLCSALGIKMTRLLWEMATSNAMRLDAVQLQLDTLS